jgi:SAM-dependent methyltransferase
LKKIREKLDKKFKTPHLRVTAPSTWVQRFAPLVRTNGPVLDVACGGGRHTKFFLERGHPVVGIDKDLEHVCDLGTTPDVKLINFELENGSPLPVNKQKFSAIILIYYIYRPLFTELIELLEPGGLFICESFAHGDEVYHSPHNPDHLLANGELLDVVQSRLQVVAYEHGLVASPFPNRPFPGILQRICATNDRIMKKDGAATAPPHPIDL